MSHITKNRPIPANDRAALQEIMQHDDWEQRLAEYEHAKSKPKKKRKNKAGGCPPVAAVPGLGS